MADEPIDLSSLEAMGVGTRHYRAICGRCDRTETVIPGAFYEYQLSDGAIKPSFGRVVWCFECDGIRVGERLPQLPFCESLLQDIIENGIDENELQRKADFIQTTIDPIEELERQTQERRATVEWLRERTLPPRCLNCGSVNIRECDTTYTHPNCGGRFKLSIESHTPRWTRYAKLGPDGSRIDVPGGE